MTTQLSRRSALTIVAFALLVNARPALAGPPLLCHPFDIGTSTSLPWDDSRGWKGMRTDYDLSRLTADTLALLTPSTPVIVRMEALRRAALYATLDAAAARAPTTTLMNRAKAAGPGGKPDTLALFDAGYFAETLEQAAPMSPNAGKIAADIDGYAMVRTSLAQSGNDPAIEFAAALISAHPARGTYDEHARRARAGAPADTLLAKNIGQLGK